MRLVTIATSSKITIIQDTREQRPLQFSDRVDVLAQKLEIGDYSVQGLENCVALERKSLSDLTSTLIQNRERFARELDKAKEYKYFAIVCEASVQDLLNGCYRSKANPQSVLSIACSIAAGRHIPVYFVHDRVCASIWIETMLRQCARIYAAKPQGE